MCPSSPIGTSKVIICEKREDCIYAHSVIRLLALPMEMSKQQPLTPCEYIVLPFRIVYIRSVSVVATRPLSIFKFCENLIVRASFNNALRSLMSDNLSEVSYKGTKKR